MKMWWTTRDAITGSVNRRSHWELGPMVSFVLEEVVPRIMPDGQPSEWLQIPDDYLIEVKDFRRLVCGKEEGTFFFSPKGFMAMGRELREAFIGNQEEWKIYSDTVYEFYKRIEINTHKHIEQLEDKINDLKDGLETLQW